MGSDFFAKTTPNAAKDHVCEMCSGDIFKGQLYVKVAGLYCNDFFSAALHPQCDALVDKYLAETYEHEYSYDEVVEWSYSYCHVCPLYNESGDCSVQDDPWKCQHVFNLLTPKEGGTS